MSEITVYYLEMHSPDRLLPASIAEDLNIQEARVKRWPLNRFLYQYVGGPWDWKEKLSWTDSQWQAYAETDSLRTWIAYDQGSPAGYFELEKQLGDSVEIKYFGLADGFIGKGFGGHMLTLAIEKAWSWGEVKRVWVHTCSLDHPSALSNYQARGMQLYKTEVEAA
ncbi:MAG: GNAT family N-acetyltransferase [Halioglobus sp.]